MRTESAMVSLGTAMPSFRLREPATGRWVSQADLTGPCVVVMILSNHCPFVLHLAEALGRLSAEFPIGGRVDVVGINGNDAVAYPADGPDLMPAMAERFAWQFPYLHDPDQRVVTAFKAACTPDFFVFGKDRRLAYRGQFDASRPARTGLDGTVPITGSDLRTAIQAVLAGAPVPEPQRPSLGCNVKWAAGREPSWYHG